MTAFTPAPLYVVRFRNEKTGETVESIRMSLADARTFAAGIRGVTDQKPEILDAATRERAVVVVGWDGASRPMRRYEDELHLPEHARSIATTTGAAA